MAYINLPPSLYSFFDKIDQRLLKLETANRFTAPVVPVLGSAPTITGLTAGDPSDPRAGDIWLNSTTNTPKYVDATGAVKTLGGGSGGVPYGPRYLKAGYIYAPIGLLNEGGAVGTANSTAWAVPFYVPATTTAVSLLIDVMLLAGTSSNMRLGIYNNSATDDYPNALVIDAGIILTDTVSGSTGKNIITISVSLTAGLYWLVSAKQGTGLPNIRGYTVTGATVQEVVPTGIISSSSFGAVAWTATGVSGALPATWTATKTLAIQAPAVWIGF